MTVSESEEIMLSSNLTHFQIGDAMVISAHCEPITKDRLSLKCKILSGWTLSKNANVEYHLNAL